MSKGWNAEPKGLGLIPMVIEQIERDTDRDNFLTPDEALEYGLIDKVLQSRA